jgi:hypothetical protein
MPTLIGEKIEGSISTRVGKNGILLREQTHTYTVEADNAWQDRAEIIFNTPGLPQYGFVYTGGLTVKSINADRTDEHELRWKVAVVGSSEVEEDQQTRNNNSGNTSNDPTTWVPIAGVKFEPYDVVLKRDFSTPKKSWKNSANKPFETGLIYQRRIATVPFSQFEPISTTLETIMDRCDVLNSEVYKGKPEFTLLLNVENATIGTYSGMRCWRVDYTMRYREDTWILKQADVGWGFYDSSGEYQTFYIAQWKDGTYDPSKAEDESFLGLLNLNGTPVANQQTGAMQHIDFQLQPAIDFNSFLKVLFV